MEQLISVAMLSQGNNNLSKRKQLIDSLSLVRLKEYGQRSWYGTHNKRNWVRDALIHSLHFIHSSFYH
jgi:hypothetical protein